MSFHPLHQPGADMQVRFLLWLEKLHVGKWKESSRSITMIFRPSQKKKLYSLFSWVGVNHLKTAKPLKKTIYLPIK